MGFVLDSSVLIAAERDKRPVSELLASLSAEHSETEFLISSITVMELEHGWHRANRPDAAAKRRCYLDEVLGILPVEAFTREMGVLAAKIDAEMKKDGLVITTADLLIGITAVHYGYAVGARNIRHFKMIPGLKVIPLYLLLDEAVGLGVVRKKLRGSPAMSFKQPPSPGDTHDVSRRSPVSFLCGIPRIAYGGGRWPEPPPICVPEARPQRTV